MTAAGTASDARWRDSAACRGTDPSLFFGEGQGGSDNVAMSKKARAICAGCPVQVECLAYAVDNYEDEGIWGGASRAERAAIRRRRAA